MPPGFKLGTTVTHRRIADQALAATVLLDFGYTKEQIYKKPEMNSVPTFEKMDKSIVGKLGSLVVRPEGSPKLVKTKEVDAKEDFA